jgi:hypothetical protein
MCDAKRTLLYTRKTTTFRPAPELEREEQRFSNPLRLAPAAKDLELSRLSGAVSEL